MSKRVLVVEDAPTKWEDIRSVITPVLPTGSELLHVGDMVSARTQIFTGRWDLLILDVSLDINPNGGSHRGGQQFTGGLTLASRMHYLRRMIPTIIVTGFETFLSAKPQNGQDVVLGLQDVEREMRKYLKEHVVGVVRYRFDGWEAQLSSLTTDVLSR